MSSNPKLTLEWKLKIEQYQASGLCGKTWCSQQGVKYRQFRYWKRKFKVENSREDLDNSSTNSFVELKESSNASTRIRLECKGIILHVSKQFDASTLSECLMLLREI